MVTQTEVAEAIEELQNLKEVREGDHSERAYKSVDGRIGAELGPIMTWYFFNVEPDIAAAGAFGMGLAAGLILGRKNGN